MAISFFFDSWQKSGMWHFAHHIIINKVFILSHGPGLKHVTLHQQCYRQDKDIWLLLYGWNTLFSQWKNGYTAWCMGIKKKIIQIYMETSMNSFTYSSRLKECSRAKQVIALVCIHYFFFVSWATGDLFNNFSVWNPHTYPSYHHRSFSSAFTVLYPLPLSEPWIGNICFN